MHYPLPKDLTQAVTSPALVMNAPIRCIDAWLQIKALRGQPISRDRYQVMQHLRAVRPMCLRREIASTNPVDAALNKARAAITAAVSRRAGSPDGGDAA